MQIKQEIETRRALFFAVNECAFVARVAQGEFVIVCAEGEQLAGAGAFITDMARALGCQSVRFHTKHRGVPRLLKQLNPVEYERVYKIQV